MKTAAGSRLTLFMIFALPFSTVLGQPPVKGRWIFSTDTPLGQFQADGLFQTNGNGLIMAGDKRLVPFSEREKGARCRATFEAIELLPEGLAISAVFRGSKTNLNTIEGNMIIMTESPDNSSTLAFSAFHLLFPGKRIEN
jgi:hypothetical protein